MVGEFVCNVNSTLLIEPGAAKHEEQDAEHGQEGEPCQSVKKQVNISYR